MTSWPSPPNPSPLTVSGPHSQLVRSVLTSHLGPKQRTDSSQAHPAQCPCQRIYLHPTQTLPCWFVAFVLRRPVPLPSRIPILEGGRAGPEPGDPGGRLRPVPSFTLRHRASWHPSSSSPSVETRHSKDREILSQEVLR